MNCYINLNMSEGTSKEILINTIKEWIAVNKKMTEIQRILKEYRLKKKLVEASYPGTLIKEL